MDHRAVGRRTLSFAMLGLAAVLLAVLLAVSSVARSGLIGRHASDSADATATPPAAATSGGTLVLEGMGFT